MSLWLLLCEQISQIKPCVGMLFMSYRFYLDSFYGVKLTLIVNVKKWMKSEGGYWPSQSL